jgi:hypothetical protein
VRGVGKKEQETTHILELMPLCPWQSSLPFKAKKEQRDGYGDHAAKNDDFQYGIVTADPLHRNILKRKDQLRQHKQANPPQVVAIYTHKSY